MDTKLDYQRTLEVLEKSNVDDKIYIKLKEIIKTAERNNINHLVYNLKGDVKYPYGKIISFEQYKLDMKNRIDSSYKYFL